MGEKYFAWALFYDMLGTLLGAYGLAVALAARFGTGTANRAAAGSDSAAKSGALELRIRLGFPELPPAG
ncbi:MAG: AEC family transporter, partial [Oscillatoria sp. Prado101]|nr:AEC family transporter [Oscillatoria sp. Prado101]